MTVEEIYQQNVRPLPAADQRQLADMIVEGLAPRGPVADDRVHLADLIETLPPGPRCFATWEEYERALQADRDSWDR
jgi:hypothetical protein